MCVDDLHLLPGTPQLFFFSYVLNLLYGFLIMTFEQKAVHIIMWNICQLRECVGKFMLNSSLWTMSSSQTKPQPGRGGHKYQPELRDYWNFVVVRKGSNFSLIVLSSSESSNSRVDTTLKSNWAAQTGPWREEAEEEISTLGV